MSPAPGGLSTEGRFCTQGGLHVPDKLGAKTRYSDKSASEFASIRERDFSPSRRLRGCERMPKTVALARADVCN